MPVQTRFRTNLNGDINAAAVSALLDDAPAFSTGQGTFERGEASEENIAWRDLSGLTIEQLLRGLSSTALTFTEIAGNKLPHSDNAVFEATLLHYIVNEKADLTENETYTGDNLFTGDNESTGTFIFKNDGAESKTDAAPTVDKALTNKKYVDDQVATKVGLTGNENITGIKTFADDSARTATNAAPIDEKSLANKKYVDDQIGTAANNKVAVSATELSPGYLQEQLVSDSNGYLDWEKDGADGADQTLRPVVNAAAILSNATPSVNLVAGEAIDGSSVPKAVAILCDGMYGQKVQKTNGVFNIAGTSYAIGSADASTRRAIPWTVSVDFVDEVTLVSVQFVINKTGTPADNLYIEICEDDGGDVGDVIANGISGTIAGGGITSGNIRKFSFGTPPTLTVGQTYYIVLRRSGANDGANYYGVESINSGANAHKVYTGSSGLWADTGETLGFIASYTYDGEGKAVLASASSGARARLAGFTSSDVVAGENVAVQPYGFNNQFDGNLTIGRDYFLSNLGDITNSTTMNASLLFPVGRAFSDSVLNIDLKDRLYKVSLIPGSPNQDMTGSWEYFIDTGFEPREVLMALSRNTGSDVELSISLNSQRILGADDLNGLYETLDDISKIHITKGSITLITLEKKNNGVLLSSSLAWQDMVFIIKG